MKRSLVAETEQYVCYCRTVLFGSTNCYILVDKTAGEALLIDPGGDAAALIKALAELEARPALIVNTHGHWDHIGANKALQQHYGLDIAIHAADAPMLTDGAKNAARLFRGDGDGGKAGRLLADGDSVGLGQLRLQVLHTPGHTPDHCSPSVIYNDRTIFTFSGEAVGTVYTDDRILSTPTSMPPNFKFNDYIASMSKVKNMKPEIMGLCHYGMITGESDINFMIDDNFNFMHKFKEEIVNAFNENPSTEYVLSKTEYLWEGRTKDNPTDDEGKKAFLKNLRLALTYGVMVDLGLRKPKYERKS